MSHRCLFYKCNDTIYHIERCTRIEYESHVNKNKCFVVCVANRLLAVDKFYSCAAVSSGRRCRIRLCFILMLLRIRCVAAITEIVSIYFVHAIKIPVNHTFFHSFACTYYGSCRSALQTFLICSHRVKLRSDKSPGHPLDMNYGL